MGEEATKEVARRRLWTDDASADGKQSSLDVVLGRLTTERNYDAYRGGAHQSGKTKEVLCDDVVAELKAQGITHRSNSDVRTKLNELEHSYRRACDWLAQTGQGIIDSNAPDSEK